MRARRSEHEAAAREFIARCNAGQMTPEVIAELRRREKIANLSEWTKTCDDAIERGHKAAKAKAEFGAELRLLRGDS